MYTAWFHHLPRFLVDGSRASESRFGQNLVGIVSSDCEGCTSQSFAHQTEIVALMEKCVHYLLQDIKTRFLLQYVSAMEREENKDVRWSSLPPIAATSLIISFEVEFGKKVSKNLGNLSSLNVTSF